MECPICFEIISNSCYASCSHRFCYNCLKKWCFKGGITCPMCKDRIFQIILDHEFDLKNNPNNKEKIEKEDTKIVYVNFNDRLGPGITIEKRIGSRDQINNNGIIVIDLEKNKKLKEYLKPGNKILYLNGVPCIDSLDTIDVIKYYYKKEGILKIELEDNKNYTRLCCLDFFL